jgi:DNA topoisomerase-2
MTASQYLINSSREYSIYVCATRAIPAVQDGLKHGQRIALWLLRNRPDKLKTFALSGLMGYERLYVHGETSANNMIGLLAAPYKNNAPLIEGLGQFGNRVAPVEGIGAPRYTEVRRAKTAEMLLYRDLDLVPLKDNYDGSNKEPIHFLPLVPLVLLNGISGIAVGWSTEILPRALKGLVQATKDALNEKETLKGLEPSYDRYNITVKGTGLNQYEFSGKAVIEDSSTVRIIELPPDLSLENFRKRLIQMEELDTIVSFTDRSTDSIDISVKFKRGSIKNWKPDTAIDYFKLREKTTERIVVIDWNGISIRTYSDAASVVRDFVEWRLSWYTKRFEKLLADTDHERNYWLVLRALFQAGFTKKLGTFTDRAAMAEEVSKVVKKAKLFVIDSQMDRVLNLATYRWTKEFEAEVETKIAALSTSIFDYKATLEDPAKLKAVYLSELDELVKLK